MEPDTAVASAGAGETEIMAAVEEGPVDTFVIADVDRDGAFLTTPLADAATLPAWR
ncbi:MAG: hypothetical protein V5A55_08265 [Halovenus sp.]